MITKEMIKTGLENRNIIIGENYYGCVGLCCRIGDNAFYFLGHEGENLSVQEYWQAYTLDMTVDMLYNILKNEVSADENGLCDGEYKYYCQCLELTDFITDIEKMRDFFEISKEEFLFSYSYLTEKEYILTENRVALMNEVEITKLKMAIDNLPIDEV